MSVLANKLYSCVVNDIFAFLKANPELSIHKAKALSVLPSCVLKKFEDRTNANADAAALELFIKVNDELLDSVDIRNPDDNVFFHTLRKELWDFWHIEGNLTVCEHLSDALDLGYTGPGSSLGTKRTDFYGKMFASKLTTTNAVLYRTYSDYVSSIPSLASAEKHRVREFGDYSLVGRSRLSFVPKSDKISRTICTEPSLNMFYQLGFGELLIKRLRSWKVNLSTQPFINRDMAYKGSIDGSYATIDLSSASDTLSLGVLRQLLPPQMMRWLELLRTPEVELPDGRTLALRMVSTMGNGFTFPLETLLFSALVRTVYRLNGTPFKYGKNRTWSVFGDDIICLAKHAEQVIYYLRLLGFKPNDSKTFVEGAFRESCGRDFFRGHEVRGVYVKSLKQPQDRYVAINKFNDWSAKTGIPLISTVQCLLETVPKSVVCPPDVGMESGIHVPLCLSGKKRDYQGGIKYRLFKPRPYFDKYSPASDKLKSGIYVNHDGLLIAFLGGYIRGYKIGLRQQAIRYTLKPGYTPMWDVLPDPDRSYRRFCFAQWVTAVHINLMWY